MPKTTYHARMLTRRLLRYFLLLTAAWSVPPTVLSQEGAPERLFREGLADFRAGDYRSAAARFGSAADAPGGGPRTSAAWIMAAKAEYRAGDYAAARSRAEGLLGRFPSTAYADEGLYIRALSEFRLGNYEPAASTLVTLLRSHEGSALAPGCRGLFREIVTSRLPLSEQKRLASADLPRGLHAAAALALARSYARRGEDSLAAGVLDALSAHPEGAASAAEIGAIRAEIGAGEGIQIGALLPLMEGRPGSDIGRIGGELLDGIRFAADEFNGDAPQGARVDVSVLDTGRDTAAAAAHVRALAASGKIRAVIGPVFSDDFAAASAIANAAYLPIISPTATADRLAAEGPFIFQANPDNPTRGRAMARYAVRELRMSSFAVLASDDAVGRSHAEAFMREAGALGATVYCAVFFPPEASDLRQEFLSVRRAVMADGALVRREDLLKPGIAGALAAYGIDTLLAAADSTPGPYVSVTGLFGARGYVIAESLGLAIAVPDTTAGETDVPLAALDGMFIALGDPGQIDYVAPQMRYFNIRAQILGNNEWYDPERLRDNADAADGVLFIADSWIDDADSAVSAFVRSFRARKGKEPTKFTLYGYDTMALILDQVRRGARTRNDIAAGLSGVEGFRGLHSEITLRGGRVNGHLHLVKYSSGTFTRMGAVTGGDR